ncbi:MAG: helix-turn-helix transcriptional regulator [Oscillospiraceae bacterium]|nr:helix-turn-helix transcriptional regulator [Oscillospiraceae bacterium]
MDMERRTLQAQIDALQAENEWLRRHYEYLRRQELASHLLTGRFLDVDKILQDLAEVGIHLEKETYMVLSIRVLTEPRDSLADNTGEDKMFFERVTGTLEEYVQSEFRRHYECHVVHVDMGAICLLGLDSPGPDHRPPERFELQMSLPRDNMIETINRIALSIYDHVKSEQGLELFIAVSRPCSSVEQLPEIYPDVQRITEYRQLMDLDVPVLCYHDFEMADTGPIAGFNTLLQEKEYLRQVELGNYPEARRIMLQIVRHDLEQQSGSLNSIRIRTVARIHTLTMTLHRFLGEGDSPIQAKINQCARQIEEDTLTIPQLLELVDQVFDAIEENALTAEDDRNPRWFPKMLAYIEARYRDPDFNVAAVSEYLDMTPSYLTREMRRMTGSSLFDYIQQLRVQAAQAAMAHGVNVQDASIQSGFGDARSMRRAFQKYLHTNPSDM